MDSVTCPIFYWYRLTPKKIAIKTPQKQLTYHTLHHLVSQASYNLTQQASPSNTSFVRLVATPSIKTICYLFALFRHGYCVNLIDPNNQHTTGYLTEWMPLVPPLNTPHQASDHPPYWALSKPATIIWTSGSSSVPKGAVHTLANHLWAALGSFTCNHFSNNDQWLLCLPLHHVSGLSILFRCFLRGATCCLAPSTWSFKRALVTLKPSHCSIVMPQLHDLVETDTSYPYLRYLLFGGSHCPVSLIKKAINQSLPLALSYGLTEMGGQVATTPRVNHDHFDNTLTNADPLPYRQVIIKSDNQIWVNGRSLFLGYLTTTPLGTTFTYCMDQWGYINTHDLGHMTPTGLTVIGRNDLLFISGGENIQPETIEQLLITHPDIHYACVVPIPSKRYGHRPVAFIAPHQPNIHHWCHDRIHAYQRPVAYLAWPETMSKNKPSRPQLTQEAMAILDVVD